jgi:hypothetical protein
MAEAFIRHRRLTVVGAIVLAVMLAWLGADWLGASRSEQHYQAVVQEVDRVDPTWREGISAALVPIPDDDNSALRIDAAMERIPPGWSALKGQWPPLVVNPARPLPAELLAELRLRRDQARGALGESRALADHPRGRFPGWSVEVPRAVPLNRQKVESVSGLLYLDALIRIEENDMAGAATDVRAMICAGRAIDLEPLLAAQAGRVNAIVPAVATIERLLAHGELPRPVLAGLQKLLEDEATHPLALISLRGERAAQEKLNEQVRMGEVGVSNLFEPGRSPPSILFSWRTLRENQARLLEETTRLIELCRLPPEQQGAAFQRQQDSSSQEWNNFGIVERVYGIPFHESFQSSLGAGNWQSRHRANLNLAIFALATERFRLDHGHWPNAPGELVPAYFSSIPFDPYAIGPLQWKRDDRDVSIYSVGVNGKDDGGVWPPGDPYSYNKDLGFRLKDPGARIQIQRARP